jgi:hypothetical protein
MPAEGHFKNSLAFHSGFPMALGHGKAVKIGKQGRK